MVAGRIFSRGIVPSALTEATAACPHAAAMAGPARRAGGDVIFPWADTVATIATRTANKFFMINNPGIKIKYTDNEDRKSYQMNRTYRRNE